MTGVPAAMVTAAAAIVVLMLGTWLLSLKLKNASIVDIVWGLGFVIVGWAVRITTHGCPARQWLLVAMVSIWGLRLAGYLYWRNHGKGEDYRYRAMRKVHGERFGLVSLYTVFGLQGTLMWIVSLPLQLGQARHHPAVGAVAVIGVVVWAIGLGFEAIGDWQLARFKADAANQGKVMRTGLWRYTRHPNYFGDACVWWGIALVAAETGIGAIGFVGAAVMTIFLRRVSGVTLLEKSLVKRREGYTDYVATTSAFFPRPPKRGAAG
jgi:steroid 5-alpha reductase family enzyme